MQWLLPGQSGKRTTANIGIVLALQSELNGLISAHEILDAVCRSQPANMVLVEGRARLMGHFFAERCLNEQFLTLAPQVAGRDNIGLRPGLVMGRSFALECPPWATPIEVKRGGSHHFLRYSFDVAKSSNNHAARSVARILLPLRQHPMASWSTAI